MRVYTCDICGVECDDADLRFLTTGRVEHLDCIVETCEPCWWTFDRAKNEVLDKYYRFIKEELLNLIEEMKNGRT